MISICTVTSPKNEDGGGFHETAPEDFQLRLSNRNRSVSAATVRATATGDAHSATLARIASTRCLNRYLTAYRTRNADHLGFDDLSWCAVRFRDQFRFADLTAGRIGDLAGPNFLCHRTGGVRNLFRHGFTGPRAGGVRNLLRHCFTGPRAGRIGNLLRHRFAGP